MKEQSVLIRVFRKQGRTLKYLSQFVKTSKQEKNAIKEAINLNAKSIKKFADPGRYK